MYQAKNNTTQALELNVSMDAEKHFQVIYATEKYRNAQGDLILWKGGFTQNRQPTLVKLILDKDSLLIVCPRSNKFRCNNAYVEAIYQLTYQSCCECKKWAIWKHEGKLWCRLHGKQFNEEMEHIQFEEKTSEIQECQAPFQYHFVYKQDQKLNLGEIPKETRTCHESGFYGFLNQELVFDYVFYECLQPDQNIWSGFETLKEENKEENGTRQRQKIINSSNSSSSSTSSSSSSFFSTSSNNCLLM